MLQDIHYTMATQMLSERRADAARERLARRPHVRRDGTTFLGFSWHGIGSRSRSQTGSRMGLSAS